MRRSIGSGPWWWPDRATWCPVTTSSSSKGDKGKGKGCPDHFRRSRSRSPAPRSVSTSDSSRGTPLPPVFSAFPPVRPLRIAAPRPTTTGTTGKGTQKGARPEEVRPVPDPEPQPGENLNVRAGYLELINTWWTLRNQNPAAAQLAWNFLVDNAPPHPAQTANGRVSSSRRV